MNLIMASNPAQMSFQENIHNILEPPMTQHGIPKNTIPTNSFLLG
jgi:hypothetical protein